MDLAPTRRPDWRWQRAQTLIEDHRRPTPRTDDAWTILANKYFLAKRCKTKRRDAAFDRIERARKIYVAGGKRRLAIEAWLLAGLTMKLSHV